MEFELKIGKQGHVYLPKSIRRNFGEKLKAVPNTRALVIFSENTVPQAVISSLKVIIADLELQVRRPIQNEC